MITSLRFKEQKATNREKSFRDFLAHYGLYPETLPDTSEHISYMHLNDPDKFHGMVKYQDGMGMNHVVWTTSTIPLPPDAIFSQSFEVEHKYLVYSREDRFYYVYSP